MKSKLLLACTILFFCSSFLCGQNQTSKVANSAETNNGAVRHPWQGKEWDIWETLLQIPTAMVTR